MEPYNKTAVPICHNRTGYSLVFVSVLLTAAAVAFAAVLPGQQAGDVNYKSMSTTQKLQKVETALTGFMAANGRLPCPADGSSAIGTATFGKEVDTLGDGLCTGAPMGPDAGTGNVVAGTIPTNSIGLDDSYAFDEWNRRITYVVDRRATGWNGCVALMNNGPVYLYQGNGTGGILIKNGTTGAVIDNTMHAFISHGPDGHGAFPAQGSSVAGRIDVGSIDVDELTNAGVNSSFVYNTTNFTNVKVMKDRTSTFDDIVYYAQYQKNTCAVGPYNGIHTGFRLDGVNAGDNTGSSVAVGDVNGDGIPDLIIGDGSANGQAGYVYVVFGTKNGFPNPLPLSSLNGTNGFRLNGVTAGDATGFSVATGDVNADGYADIIIGTNGANSNAGYTYVVYAGPTMKNGTAWTTCPCTLTAGGSLINGTNGFRLDGVTGGALSGDYVGYSVATGDVNGDGVKDLIIGAPGANTNVGYTYVVLGKVPLLPVTTVNTTSGSTSATVASFTDMVVGQTVSSPHIPIGTTITACGGGTICSSNNITLSAAATATAAGTAFSIITSPLDIGSGTLINGTTGFRLDGTAVTGTLGFPVITGDVNGDGNADIIISAEDANGGAGYVYVVFSNSSGSPLYTPLKKDGTAWPAAGNVLLTAGGSVINGTNGFRLDGVAAFGSLGRSIATGDINGDGYADIVIGALQANSDAGYSYVVFGGTGPKGDGLHTWATSAFASSAGDYLLNLTGTGTGFINGSNGFRLDGVTASDYSGNAVATGDINADGYADIIIGAEGGNGGTFSGYTYVVFGGPARKSGTAWPAAGNLVLNTGGSNVINGIDGFRFNGATGNDWSAFAVTTGDINGDGVTDIITSADHASYSGANTGSIYAVFGQKQGFPWQATSSLGSLK